MFEKVYKDNEGMVKEVAGKVYKSFPQLDYEEIYQNSLIGLMMAIKTYKKEKGVKFTTHAYRSVYGYALRTYYRDNWYTKNKYNKKTKLYDRVPNNHLYLDEKSGHNEENETFLDMTIGVKDEQEEIINRIMLEEGFKKLTKEELEVIRARYYEGKTYREIGEKIDKTPQCVKHREGKALEKLRRVIKND